MIPGTVQWVHRSILSALVLTLVITPPSLAGIAAGDPAVRRITVLETNNFRLDRGFRGLALPDSLAAPELAELREYIRPLLASRALSELELLFVLTAAVHARITHHPFGNGTPQMTALEILQGGEAGKRFSCVEYGRALSDLLISQGIAARSMSLQSKTIAYGDLASGHVLTEAWSNTLDKWILLDAQWGVFAELDGKPINVYEVFQAKARGDLERVRFKSVSNASDMTETTARDAEYRSFLSPYLGYLSARLLSDDEGVPVLLAMEGDEWPLTFQGLPRKAHVFARGPDDLYFRINHTSLVMEFRPDAQPLTLAPLELGSAEDYPRKMAQFAAVPDFDVTPHHNMPWFTYFEYAIDPGEWRRLESTRLRWQLGDGDNTLKVRAVNAAGRRGPVTTVRIRYAP